MRAYCICCWLPTRGLPTCCVPPQGLKETQEDRARDRERIRAAAAFDDFDRRIEKHWTEKVR